MLGLQIQIAGPLVQGPKEQGSRDYADRLVAAKQGYGDADETVLGRKPHPVFSGVAYYLTDSDQTGQSPGDRQGDNSDVAGIYSGGARGGLTLAHGADFIAEGGSPEQNPDEHSGEERQRKRGTDGGRAKDGELMDEITGTNRPSFWILGIGILQQVNGNVTGETGGNAIGHDGIDDFVTAAP